MHKRHEFIQLLYRLLLIYFDCSRLPKRELKLIVILIKNIISNLNGHFMINLIIMK